ncbi:MAG TPA: EAL domain-containing protein [Steroidobacteraceae bacterium]|jgi:diguanylate cyclase (GGDEF)-like protein/PAS domain S-box-containing protein
MEVTLSEQNAVPLIVLSTTRDPVESINSILRRAGHPVHCTWIPSLRDLGDALAQINPELLLFVDTGNDELAGATAVRDQLAPSVPIITVADGFDESRIAVAMAQGARDVVTLANPARLQAVMGRELRSFRLERALETTLKSARDARRQLETVLERSNDAIVQVQEGIIVDANPSWCELFGIVAADSLVGQPIMDLFEEATHPALKGALAACLQGRWSDHTLKLNAVLADGTSLPLDMVLTPGEHDGDPCVRMVVPARPRDERLLADDLADAVRRDPSTGFLYRRPLLDALKERLATPVPGGVRYFALVKPDKFATIERDVGAAASEEFLVEFATLLKEHLNPKDIAGRFGGVSFLVLLERGNERDVEAWGDSLIAKAAKHVVRVGDKQLSVTCTVGLSVVAPTGANLDATIADAVDACRKGRGRGGNQAITSDKADNDTRVQSYDKVWVKHIKAALMENRFRLVQQPVASLQGDDPSMFDVLVRMIDTQGKEVLPAEFMAAAERNDLLKNIDRWVVGASLSFAAQRKPGCLFVRLSKDTVRDGSFLDWLDNHIRASRADPARISFQIPEIVAASQLSEAKALANALRQRGFRFALEGFGSGRDPQGMLNGLPLDFVKIDGAIVQNLAGDADLQNKVRMLAEAAGKKNVQTIAERVENANTMAVLWQLGVQFIQGYFVNAPEEVVLRAER